MSLLSSSLLFENNNTALTTAASVSTVVSYYELFVSLLNKTNKIYSGCAQRSFGVAQPPKFEFP